MLHGEADLAGDLDNTRSIGKEIDVLVLVLRVDMTAWSKKRLHQQICQSDKHSHQRLELQTQPVLIFEIMGERGIFDFVL